MARLVRVPPRPLTLAVDCAAEKLYTINTLNKTLTGMDSERFDRLQFRQHRQLMRRPERKAGICDLEPCFRPEVTR